MLLDKHIAKTPNAKTLLLFGGNPYRRDEVVRLLMPIKNLSVYGSLSEEEGLKMLDELEKVDMVLIGGRYTNEQRHRIKQHIKLRFPHVKVTEPGVDYPYQEALIKENILKLML